MPTIQRCQKYIHHLIWGLVSVYPECAPNPQKKFLGTWCLYDNIYLFFFKHLFTFLLFRMQTLSTYEYRQTVYAP